MSFQSNDMDKAKRECYKEDSLMYEFNTAERDTVVNLLWDRRRHTVNLNTGPWRGPCTYYDSATGIAGRDPAGCRERTYVCYAKGDGFLL